MTILRATSSGLCLLLSVMISNAQTPTTTASAPAPATPPYVLGPLTFSGLIDLYYDYSFNHPASGFNQLRNFDLRANQFSLNMAKLTVQHDPDPLGFRLDLGFGRAFDTIHAAERAPEIFRYLEQVYVSIKPPKAGGLQLDFGEFVTSAGAEVIETNSNWNYSRSLLFAWAIPYYHVGVRTTVPVGKHFSGTAQLVNGWNNVEDNNSGKTVGVGGTFTSSKVTWANVYYAGPEKPQTNKGWRQLYDTVLTVTPHPNFSAYLNYDYGREKGAGRESAHWTGVAGAARYQATPIFAISPRLEWFHDADGFSTGVSQRVKEFTLTGEFKIGDAIVTRAEYRRDWSDNAFFERGTGGLHKNQDTILVGLIAYFGPKK